MYCIHYLIIKTFFWIMREKISKIVREGEDTGGEKRGEKEEREDER